jgi:hypothetical protein
MRKRSLGLTSVLAGVCLASLSLVPSEVARPDASGCSRHDDTKPAFSGCISSPDKACYHCEYSSSAGFKTCYENPEGTTQFCIDQQTVPF